MLLSSCGVLKDQAVDNIKFQFRMKYFTSAVNMNTGVAVCGPGRGEFNWVLFRFQWQGNNSAAPAGPNIGRILLDGTGMDKATVSISQSRGRKNPLPYKMYVASVIHRIESNNCLYSIYSLFLALSAHFCPLLQIMALKYCHCSLGTASHGHHIGCGAPESYNYKN